MAKIVFCEDEARIQKLIRVMLQSTNHEVFIAADGVEGLAMIEQVRPALVFVDISMPHCDGFQLAAAIRARPDLASTPIIFVTAFARPEDVDEAFRLGAVGYVTKPFSPADLRAMIAQWSLSG